MSRLSFHACERAAEMCVDESEVVAVMTDPEVVYPSPHVYGPNRFVRVGGRLAVVCGSDGTAITVLWRGKTARHPIAARMVRASRCRMDQ